MSMSNTEKKVKDIRRNTRRKFSTEEKIRIVLDGLANQGRASRRHWNRIPDSVRSMIVEVALDRPERLVRPL